MNRLADMHVAVFGAAGAIGREVVRQVVQEGGHVAVADLPSDALRDLEREVAELDARSTVHAVDAADPDDVRGFVRGAEDGFGAPLDGLVNVAGYWEIVDFVESDEEHWRKMLQANLLTALTTCHAALPSMLAAGRGAIVNFASTAGEYGSIRPSAAYAAAKGGVIGFTKSLAREVSPLGVRVNAISPGPIDTPALQAASAEQRTVAASRTLVGRMGTPTDIARGVVYLLSEDSSFVTGDVLRVNGGSLI